MGAEDLSKAAFTIAYDGKAIKDGSMDVRDLAPALLAVGQLFDAANHTLNGSDAPPITVNVQATNKGSFEIDLTLIQGLMDGLKSFFSGDGVTAALNLKEFVFGGTATAFSLAALIKHLRGRKPDRIEKISADTVRITIDGESVDIPLKLLRLYQDVAVRKSYEHLVAVPLQKDGIDEFRVLESRVEIASVTREHAAYYIAPELPAELVVEDTRRAAFSIVSLAFKENNKWRLHDGNNQISAIIEDINFLERVDSNSIRFAKGDILICEVKIRQMQTESGLKTDYTVVKVLDHRPAARQIDMFIENSKDAMDFN